MIAAIRKALKAAATRLLPEDTLKEWRWYRRQRGGFWVNSHALGWQTLPDWSAALDIALAKRAPELYCGGKDIEDYRQTRET